MTFLVANIPPVKCFVRREFLYNHEPYPITPEQNGNEDYKLNPYSPV